LFLKHMLQSFSKDKNMNSEYLIPKLRLGWQVTKVLSSMCQKEPHSLEKYFLAVSENLRW
jgi:hypothetical protein